MNPTTQGHKFGPEDRIAAFARATEVYAESLEDPDLANVYWGKSLGLWQALAILTAEERTKPRCRLGDARPAGGVGPVAPTGPAVPHAAPAGLGR
jgi:hypothetical protein